MRSRALKARATLAAALLLGAAVSCGVALAAASTSGTGSSVKVRVHPEKGTPHTQFAVSFRVPDYSSSSDQSTNRSYSLSVSGTEHSGCASSDSQALGDPAPGTQVKTTVRAPAAKWCRGRFRGRVQETISPRCSAGVACPMYVILETIARFHFDVR